MWAPWVNKIIIINGFRLAQKKIRGRILPGRISDQRRFLRRNELLFSACLRYYDDASRYNHLQISGNKTCRGHNVAAEQTDKWFSCKRFETVSFLIRFRKNVEAVSIWNHISVNTA